MASPDHWQAMQITDAAVFYSRLTKWDDHFAGLPVHKIERQLYFRLAFEPSFMPRGPGEFTVDISQTLQAKLESIACYQTQFPPEKKHIFDRVENVARSVGLAAGCEAGESFVSTRPLRAGNLMEILFAK